MPSERFLANLAASPRWVTTVDWANDGGHDWQSAELIGGTVTCAQTAQIRWSSQISLIDVPVGRDGINPYTTRFRIRRGMVFSPHEKPEFVGLGVYRVNTVRRSHRRDEVELTGVSFEDYLQRARLYRPRTIRQDNARAIVEMLIHEVLPDAVIDWHPSIDVNMTIPKLASVEDRWNTLDGDRDARSIMQALSARLYPSGDGVWLIRPIPTLQDAPEWELTEGDYGSQLEAAEELSNDGVTNVEIVVGTAGNSVIGPGIAKDTDQSSLTYVGRTPDEGGYGEVAGDEYQSQLVSSLSQAYRVAQARLASRLGLKRTLSFGMLHDPTKRAGQVGLIQAFDTAHKVILDTVPFDLSATPGPMQCQTRTQQTRLAGDISDATDAIGDLGLVS